MICVRLDGGLGNQLFQYSIGRSLAARYQCDLLLDASQMGTENYRVTSRVLELHHFRHVGCISVSPVLPKPWLKNHVSIFSRLFSRWVIYIEKGLGYNSKFLCLPDGSYLIGYWQSYRYFEDIAELLFAELIPIAPLSKENQVTAEYIQATNSVAIHVRRGDYVSDPRATRFHGVPDSSYYLKAISRVYEEVVDPTFFIFSDDIDWCYENLTIDPDKTVFVDGNSGANSWQDLVLMSKCRHHVIANSSFSWWGAWIADQRYLGSKRVVISPMNWFANQKNKDVIDRFPSHWAQLG